MRGGRRSFLALGALAAAGLAAPSCGRLRPGARAARAAGLGPLAPVPDETTGLPLLRLPQGFRCVSTGWTGDPLRDGTPTPPAHDGMAAFPAGGARVRLVRNHEVMAPGPPLPGAPAYDPSGAGGTTTLEFDGARGVFLGAYASLGGTVRNCAGGPTPWGSWLTCEETVESAPYARPHGYVFEVPAEGMGRPEPLRGMGRFLHEAVAVDPATGAVYETEDDGPTSGFYRYLPDTPSRLAAGGRLSMLALVGRPLADTRVGQTAATRDVAWVDIDDPDPVDLRRRRPFLQGQARGAARFSRLEGCWYGNGRVHFVSTNGGEAAMGQVWEYDPRAETLRLVFESPGAEVLSAPDNVCVSPHGGLLLCEDGGGADAILGLTPDGQLYRLVEHQVVLKGERNGLSGDFRWSEVAGACFSPDGRWLFFNVQAPGITFAVTGPWEDGR